ncbi:MAG TPA: XRE family transcriptional regulator [Pseudonocardia sp.]|jgi:transcriptional regulator with XRE-family HTH domain|uniref:helix-turn-helix domain-containing protein n=1 Tax=Pseudonocardia sp. TaxID=60912 RepID=UPI002B4AD238|nr:XRE family transcriptional regulator [Pseudonocardia sp.]HLU54859.1 XRE family transcriptional regulator [Pseudonocardia sp.]
MADKAPSPGQDLPVAAMLGEVGNQVRSLRKEAGLTLERLAELSGLSTGIVSQIERGLANPSFGTLVQLAHGLGIPVGALFQVSDRHRSPVVRKSERRRLEGHGIVDDGGRYELLTPDLTGALEATWVETPPGYDSSANPYRHQGEEFGLVLSGRKDVYLDGVRYELGPGDSIRYPSTTPHWYVNPGDEVCKAIWVITPPTW